MSTTAAPTITPNRWLVAANDRLASQAKALPNYWFALATLTGAFLVFQVQPVVSKIVLPWFGGTPAVWSTCLLFFQLVLFGGYLYAHVLKTYVAPRIQAIIHCGLLFAAVTSLPIEPSADWKPTGGENPIWYLMGLLAVHVGLPYFALSATGPLVQAWMSYRDQSTKVYRLYALSNIGSLAALLSYPFVVEPWLSVTQQSVTWSYGMTGFAIILALVSVTLWNVRSNTLPNGLPNVLSGASSTTRVSVTTTSNPITGWTRAAWLVLPAFASILLMNVTSHICTDVAVVPFLWVLPLSLYLLSFIIAFDSPHWYRPKPIAAIGLAGLWLAFFTDRLPMDWQMVATVTTYMVFLLAICLLCHGEAARLKPSAERLTEFYLMLSAGGAIGGLIVAVVCPLMLRSMSEIVASIYAAQAFAVIVFLSSRRWKQPKYEFGRVAVLNAVVLLIALTQIVSAGFCHPTGIVESQRNFFGQVFVKRLPDRMQLAHGQTVHGSQAFAPKHREPTSYYGRNSGVGLSLEYLQDRQSSLRVGVVGLGCGVLTTYGRPQDSFDIYEINPAVVDLASKHFTFLSDCPSEQTMHIGDGRLLLERHDGPDFDLLVLDAFSSDAIPAHLLTQQAIALYRQRLTHDGILAVHVSNNHLDLAPLVHRLAKSVEMKSLEINHSPTREDLTLSSQWVLLSPSDEVLLSQEFASGERPTKQTLDTAPLWTDQYHNLLSVLKL